MLSPQLPLALFRPPPSHHSQKRTGKLALSAEKRLSAAAGPDNICESLLPFYPGWDQLLGQEEQDRSESVWRTLVVGGETGISVGVLRESPMVDWREIQKEGGRRAGSQERQRLRWRRILLGRGLVERYF
jgi:hypothetical protein